MQFAQVYQGLGCKINIGTDADDSYHVPRKGGRTGDKTQPSIHYN